jgi:hypothetical protein
MHLDKPSALTFDGIARGMHRERTPIKRQNTIDDDLQEDISTKE